MKPAWKIIGVLVAAVIVAVFAQFYDPGTTHLVVCPFHYVTGLHCPGCGSMRSVHAMAHGHILEAIGYNPLLWVFVPVLIYQIFILPFAVSHNRHWPDLFGNARRGWIIFAVIIAFWVLRNIPVAPFTWLAP